ncbi:MAG: helix-turn-helix domain-containing protein [Kiritimatiellae bacterium]|nr:helix-turn-helix domain-containing protein [Kiritimatiellia bacterium]
MSPPPVSEGGRLRTICRTESVRALDALMREQAGVGLVLVRPGRDQKVEVAEAGEGIALPEFCRLIHGAEGGRERCSTCRSLLAVAAWNRGLVRHSCHGGIAVFAAPVRSGRTVDPEFLVVGSCAFAPGRGARGWTEAREHARGLALDVRKLRDAYGKLPHLTPRKERLVKSVIGVAASVIGELMAGMPFRSDSGAAEKEAVAAPATKSHPFQDLHRQTGSALVDVVMTVVRSNPAPPYTVADIARAAILTPNHFSALFRRHAGQTFKAFLMKARLQRSRALLRDRALSIAEVAARSGFPDANYFSRVFRAGTGITPRAWRLGKKTE